MYLFQLVPVTAAVRWKVGLTPKSSTTSDFTCTVEVNLPAILQVVARLSFLGHFLRQHVNEEAAGFAVDITRKQHQPPRSL